MNSVGMTGNKNIKAITGNITMKSSKGQRILVAHRYYWPDTPPYASILRRIALKWTQDGHSVDVLSSQPSYKKTIDFEKRPEKETIDHSVIWRLNLPNEAGRPLIRLINALRFCLALFLKIIFGKYDVVMISTVPPILGGLAAACAAKLTGARFIYHCMDIHPEVGRISGEFSNPLIFSILLNLDRWVCRQANPVIVLSEDMKQTLLDRAAGDHPKIQVINNFSLPSTETLPQSLPFNISADKLTILFAGNIGRFQGLETAIEAMGQLSQHQSIELLIMGEGVAKADLIDQAKKNKANVRFVGHYPIAVAKSAMQQADIGFVSLRPGIYRYAYPSKTLTYLEQGCPLLVAVEPESTLSSVVTSENLGYAIPNGNPEALANQISDLANTKEKLVRLREIARQKAERICAPHIVLERWSNLLS